jgi:hypothetical protein
VKAFYVERHKLLPGAVMALVISCLTSVAGIFGPLLSFVVCGAVASCCVHFLHAVLMLCNKLALWTMQHSAAGHEPGALAADCFRTDCNCVHVFSLQAMHGLGYSNREAEDRSATRYGLPTQCWSLSAHDGAYRR